jgi:hypothetical protein
MHTENKSDKWKFVIYWASATALGWITAHIMGGIVFIGAWAGARAALEAILQPVNQLDATTEATADAAMIIISVMPATIVMFFYIAALQWLTPLSCVLSSKWEWIGAGILSGSIIGLLLTTSFRSFVNAEGYLILPELEIIEVIGVIGFLGIVIGFPQWLALRRHAPQACIRIPANVIGVIAASAFAMQLGWLLQQAADSASLLGAAIGYCLGIPAVFGAITGTTLFHMLRHSKQISE